MNKKRSAEWVLALGQLRLDAAQLYNCFWQDGTPNEDEVSLKLKEQVFRDALAEFARVDSEQGQR